MVFCRPNNQLLGATGPATDKRYHPYHALLVQEIASSWTANLIRKALPSGIFMCRIKDLITLSLSESPICRR